MITRGSINVRSSIIAQIVVPSGSRYCGRRIPDRASVANHWPGPHHNDRQGYHHGYSERLSHFPSCRLDTILSGPSGHFPKSPPNTRRITPCWHSRLAPKITWTATSKTHSAPAASRRGRGIVAPRLQADLLTKISTDRSPRAQQ